MSKKEEKQEKHYTTPMFFEIKREKIPID